MTDPRAAFVEAATWHGSLERANKMLSEHPELRSSDIHTAAILGDDVAVRRFLVQDSRNATATSAPYGGDALVHLCLSKYLRLDPSRSDGFLRAATALLDSGADPSSGFWHKGEFETALYGAAGVAHHAPLTRLLLERGADPNDVEAVYHSPETRASDAMKALVATGKLTDESLWVMLIRKIDWHDEEGVRYLLERDVDPNRTRERGSYALHHALDRDNDLAIIDLLLNHGADATLREDGMSAIARAARRGRSDVLESLARRGVSLQLQGVDRLIAACAMNDEASVRSIAEREPQLVREVVAQSGKLLADFAGTGNTAGVRRLLDLGADVGAVYEGDGYFGIAENSTALHAAAWRLSHAAVKLLVDHGAPVNARDGAGRTPLALAVRGCVDSYWTEWRSPESVKALLEAGASLTGVPYPSGYADVDELLRQYGAG